MVMERGWVRALVTGSEWEMGSGQALVRVWGPATAWAQGLALG